MNRDTTAGAAAGASGTSLPPEVPERGLSAASPSRPPAVGGRTARQRIDPEERRTAILAAARRAFDGSAYSTVTVADVARAAGASAALVFHYFGSKAGLYGAVVESELSELKEAQTAADAALAAGVPVRDRVRAALLAYLEAVAASPRRWEAALRGSDEPQEARAARDHARHAEVQHLAALLGAGGADDSGGPGGAGVATGAGGPVGVGGGRDALAELWPRHAYALAGYFGFVDAATLRWLGAGCPEAERYPLVDAALGALQGALGDWRV